MAELRKFADMLQQAYNSENLTTKTSKEQIAVEKKVREVNETFQKLLKCDTTLPYLNRRIHKEFLKSSLVYLPVEYECLDASRTWLCYWTLHSLSLLQADPALQFHTTVVKFLEKCQHPSGGFGGGPGQYPHLATTYAAVNAICIVGTEEAYKVINRSTLREFLWSLRSPDGAFSMHKDGEVDIRGVYCALAVATLTNVACDNLFKGTAEWIISCQTYEGGFSGAPGMEAHGGYTFCGLAGLFLLGKAHLCDSQSLLRWLVNRQMKFEGGFQGRTNKLVDGCYSFWQAGACALLHELLTRESHPPTEFLFNQEALQEYVLICCQYKHGGLIDKPGKHADLYHTCYTLSGLSIAQSNLNGSSCVLGHPNNKLHGTHFIYNIIPIKVMMAKTYFKHADVDSVTERPLVQEL